MREKWSVIQHHVVKKKKKSKLEIIYDLLNLSEYLSFHEKKKENKERKKLAVVKLLHDIFDKLNQQKIEDKCMYF